MHCCFHITVLKFGSDRLAQLGIPQRATALIMAGIDSCIERGRSCKGGDAAFNGRCQIMALPSTLRRLSTVPAQLNNAIQCVAEAGSDAMDRNNDAKCEAQAARADLGMCLMKETTPGDQTRDN